MYSANRGTFGNIRLVNKFLGKAAPKTVHIPSGMTLDVFDAAQAEYLLIIIHLKRKGIALLLQ